jgi:5-(carboxyamino)imidazole ribonucleotide mutase
MNTPLIGIIMGSQSDWETMQHAAITLDTLEVPFETRVLSAHRTPDAAHEYGSTAIDRGLKLIIAAAGGAAHLAGVMAACTPIPILGVPMQSKALNGMDSLLSTVQMPAGIPVASLAIGKAGAINAALLATQILGVGEERFADAIVEFRRQQTEKILANPDPSAVV